MKCFKLLVAGAEFDVGEYVRTTPFSISRIWHRGKARPSGRTRTNSGFEVELGDGREMPLVMQDHIAAGFLEAHEFELSELSRFEGVERVELVLLGRLDVQPSLVGVGLGFSRRIMAAALRAHVALRIWIDVRHPGPSHDNEA